MKIFALLLALSTSIATFAQLNGNGYYRVQNDKTKRYIYVTDNKSKGIQTSTTSADMNAIQLFQGFDRASSNPATICYIKNIEGNKYDIQAQGTGVYEIIKYYVSINKRGNHYLTSASTNGVTKYLGDGESVLDADEGVLSTETESAFRNWNILPITTNSDSYFGVQPTVSHNGKYYAAYFTAFPYSFASSGMKAMYIYKVANGMAVYREISGTVPEKAPIFIECSSDRPINNKLNIGGSASTLKDNILKGVYFNTSERGYHNNQTAYDPNTMRLLGVMSDGKLGFIKSTAKYIPANSSYLTVPAGSPDEIKIISEQEYNEIAASIPTSVTLNTTTLNISVGETNTLTATVLPTTAETTLTWSSSNSAVATVSAAGVITAISEGTATITVSTSNGLTATCNVNVGPKSVAVESITLDKTTMEVFTGEQFTLAATILPTNATDKTVAWSSSNTSIATVSDNGVVTSISSGTATITATSSNGLKAECIVTVKEKIIVVESVVLNRTSVVTTAGEQFTLTATVLPENATDKTIVWSSNNTSIATVSDNGVVTALAPGNATITATSNNGLKAECAVTVKEKSNTVESITLDKTTMEVVEGEKFTLTATILPENATDKSVIWSSSNTNVATVSQSGVVTTFEPGTATITATTSNDLKAECIVTVKEKTILVEKIYISKRSLNAEIGAEIQLTVVLLPSTATNKSVVWESSDNSIATVDQNGNVKILKEGSVVITVKTTDGSNLSATCTINVASGIAEITVSGSEMRVYSINGIYLGTYESKAALAPGAYIIDKKKVVIK